MICVGCNTSGYIYGFLDKDGGSCCKRKIEKQKADIKRLKETQSPAGLVTIGECIALLKPLDVIGEPNCLVDLIAKAMQTISNLKAETEQLKGVIGELTINSGEKISDGNFGSQLEKIRKAMF